MQPTKNSITYLYFQFQVHLLFQLYKSPHMQHNPLSFFICCISLLFCVNCFSALHAQDTTTTKNKQHFKNQYYITLHAFRPIVSTSLQVNGEHGPGMVLSLEDNLGFNSRPWLFRVEGVANFTKRSGVAVTFVNMNRKNEWTVDRDITIFDTTFHVGADLDIFFNTTLIAASYKYAIFAKPTWEAGLSVGIRYLQIKTGVELKSQGITEYAESVNIPAPVPVFGVFGSAFMSDRFRMRYNFDYFTISVKGTKGGVIDNRFGLEYYIIKNLGIGAAVNFLHFQVKEIPLEKNFDGQIRYSLNGFSIFAAVKF